MNGKKILISGVVLFGSLLFSGCSMAVGASKTYCQEHGADYSDAGVCDDPWTIYQNRRALSALGSGNCGCVKK